MEVLPQTQGGVELWPGVLMLHTRVVPHRLCRPTAPPSAWSVSNAYRHVFLFLCRLDR